MLAGSNPCVYSSKVMAQIDTMRKVVVYLYQCLAFTLCIWVKSQ